MRLLEAIVAANQRAAPDGPVELALDAYADALPLVALTCIDARLNHRLPGRLGVPEEQFIWLRNAGNIITGPLSSTMRSLALACAVKGGKEIVVIGHTDCLVAKHSVMQLLESFARLGVDRARLPDNLTEFFGVFASERQNVLRACEHIRHSPLIGPKVPVHGLLLDLGTGRLEWLVNGYETFASTATEFTAALKTGLDQAQAAIGDLGEFKLGEMKFPDARIGEVASKVESFLPKLEPVLQKMEDVVVAHPEAQTPKPLVVEAAKDAARDFARHIVRTRTYKVIGDDKRLYGPITGEKLLQWIAEERVDGKTPVQVEGSTEWRPLEKLAEAVKPNIPLPPPLTPKPGFGFKRPGQR